MARRSLAAGLFALSHALNSAAAPRVTLPDGATALRLTARDGTTLVVSPEPGAALVAVCVVEGGGADPALLHDLARRGGSVVHPPGRFLPVACVALPPAELPFALSAARRLRLPASGGQASRGEHEADDASPPWTAAANARLLRLALEGTEQERAADDAVIAISGAVRTSGDGAAALGAPLEGGSVVKARSTRQSSERLSVVESPGPSPRTAYAWLVPDGTPADAAALAVSAEVLSGPLKSRLPRLLVTERSLARRVTGSVTPLPGGTLAAVFVESTTRTSVDRVRRFVDGTLKQLRLVGPTRGEVDRARARLVASALATWEDPVRRAAALLETEVLHGDARRYVEETRALGTVDAERVRRTFAERFVDARRATVEEYPPLWPADDARLAGYRLHTVEPSDTLDALARRYQVPVASLARANDLDPKRALTPGQPLWIPNH